MVTSAPRRLGATMETVVVFVLACLLYWWGML
ncbi:hypothetical protein DFR76_105275 [Nocardia pseudobrasiliensis]|uniref:Uncharacterized protein n=1 Tax=Nocardia pseudobrasiliensis TaxID=45979 RepID=A0A370I5E1_9NOCA|nr:hypothetical protein DFR76_105275 [Nocardia pseudobrasiliensis]